MLGRQPVTVEIVSEACWHKYVPQLVLFPGSSHIFGIIVITMIPFVGAGPFTKHSPISTFSILTGVPTGWSYFIHFDLFIPRVLLNMNYYHYLPCHRWGVCTAQGHIALRDRSSVLRCCQGSLCHHRCEAQTLWGALLHPCKRKSSSLGFLSGLKMMCESRPRSTWHPGRDQYKSRMVLT